MVALTSGRVRNVHPFPARMAPDVALEKIIELTKPGAIVLDPMCGSGTVPRMAAVAGRHALASDMDPLAVLMTKIACKPNLSHNLGDRAEKIVLKAKRLGIGLPSWINNDDETVDFCHYWFAQQQRYDLSRLARVLADLPQNADPLRLALSRIIITKSGGASLARDTSHSRPHRVTLENDFDVFPEFIKSAQKLEKALGEEDLPGKARVRSADARSLGYVERSSVDLIITSPPYLNAIDYLRGHKMSLVWLGWTLAQVRGLRLESIGAEKALKSVSADVAASALSAVPDIASLSNRERRMVWRFTNDMDRLCRSMSRVSKPRSHMVFVVADSNLKGVPVSNSAIASLAAEKYGYVLKDSQSRQLPMQHRYLPPPEKDNGFLGSRMREELVLTFRKTSKSI